MGDVMQVFAEQAALYIPVVFYYVGRKSLDPQKVALVSFWVLLAFQLIMGLLVIRRIHRFWASTTAARLNAQIARDTQTAAA
jgi:TRAP-type C4-dicarboxylate transport system permease small subunit